jgi:hypothetical protein
LNRTVKINDKPIAVLLPLNYLQFSLILIPRGRIIYCSTAIFFRSPVPPARFPRRCEIISNPAFFHLSDAELSRQSLPH